MEEYEAKREAKENFKKWLLEEVNCIVQLKGAKASWSVEAHLRRKLF